MRFVLRERIEFRNRIETIHGRGTSTYNLWPVQLAIGHEGTGEMRSIMGGRQNRMLLFIPVVRDGNLSPVKPAQRVDGQYVRRILFILLEGERRAALNLWRF